MKTQPTLTAIGLRLEFPAGLHPGAGKDLGNQLIISIDGQGRPVLRGTSLAGIVRHAYAKFLNLDVNNDKVNAIFGRALDHSQNGGEEQPSRLKVEDLVFESKDSTFLRTHNSIDRHRGAVRDQALFSLQMLPPRTAGSTMMWLEDMDPSSAQKFVSDLAALFNEGLTMGGNSARGIGLCHLKELRHKTYILSNIEQHQKALDTMYQWRTDRTYSLESTFAFNLAPTQQLRLNFTLSVAPGQDFLIADSNEMSPQRITTSDNREHWHLPGSSLRGLFRDWCNRLAAREGMSIADHVGHREASGKDHGWCFDDQTTQNSKKKRLAEGAPLQDLISCPVSRLFGSLYSRGRIHISDAISSKPIKMDTENGDLQHRMHVAIDMITGSANEGMLFDNQVIVAREQEFAIHILVDQPELHEAKWLVKCIRALDMGLIRVGSSKASGAMALCGTIEAKGPHHELFSVLVPSRLN